MSPSTSVVFDPEIDDRQLDREASKVDKRLAESGQINPEIGDVQGEMNLDGVGGVGGGGMGGGRGGGMPGGEGAAAGLASKIPKPIAGVTAAAALPTALVGGVGAGMLSAMHSASARLQTQGKLLGIAVDNFFREPGNILADAISGPIDDVLQDSINFDETLRQGDWMQAGFELASGININEDSLGQQIGGGIGYFLSGGNPIVSRIASGVGEDIGNNLESVLNETAAEFDWLQSQVTNLEIPEWPGWPSIDTEWPGWPSIDTEWPGWPSELDSFSWPNIPSDPWPSSSQLLSQFPSLSAGSLQDAILGNGGDSTTNTTGNTTSSNSGDSGDNGGFFEGEIGDGFGQGPIIPGFASGGRVQDSGVARVHRDEIIAPEDRLVDELSQAVADRSGGGGTAKVDTSAVENKLDRLNRNITQLAQSMQSMSVNVDGETLGRVSSDAQREEITDTDPLVR